MMLKVNKQIEDIKGQITELRARCAGFEFYTYVTPSASSVTHMSRRQHACRKEKAVVDISGILGVYCNRAYTSRICGATSFKPYLFNLIHTLCRLIHKLASLQEGEGGGGHEWNTRGVLQPRELIKDPRRNVLQAIRVQRHEMGQV
jgi:hypothetical protein